MVNQPLRTERSQKAERSLEKRQNAVRREKLFLKENTGVVMSNVLEQKLKSRARRKRLSKKEKGVKVYGTLRKTEWKPSKYSKALS